MNNQRLHKSYNLEDYFAELQNSIGASRINCHRIASIVEFNPETQRATVQIVDYITISTDSTTNKIIPALISNVPVHINSTLLGGITIPINPGDFCILEFNDRDLTNWLLSGNLSATELASNRTHSFTDAIAVIGIFPNPAPLANYNNNATEIFYQNTRISLQETNITITTQNNKQITIDADGNITVPGTATITGIVTIEATDLNLGGIPLSTASGKLTVSGKEVAVVGGITVGDATTQTINTSGQ